MAAPYKKVIDLSTWNVVNDYTKVKASGIDGAIVKVINSANGIDKRLNTHVNGLKAAGIPIIGGYNYLYANNTAKATAVAPQFFKLCNQYDIPVGWMDIEDACMKNLGENLVKIIDIYKYYANYYDVKLGIYTGTSFYNSYIKKYKDKINLPFWFARYPSIKDYNVSDPAPTTKNMPAGVDIEGWQYTSKCNVDGISGYVDMSAWYCGHCFKTEEEKSSVLQNPYSEPVYCVDINTKNANDVNWVKWNLWRQGFFGAEKNYTEVCDGIMTAADIVKVQMSQKTLGLDADGIVGRITRSVWKKILG